MSDSIELAPTPASVAMARRWSEEVLARFGAEELADTTTLLVSELVSNVVLHAHTPCSLRIDGGGGRLRVEVADGSDRLPVRAVDPDLLADSGRGMVLVEGLSEAYGVDAEPLGGKRIWFELLAPSRPEVVTSSVAPAVRVGPEGVRVSAANVLYITVDQWRGDCLSAVGHPVVRTPTLDALAARGVRFANHWSVTAPCGPSRASLHTGQYMMNHRSVNNGTPLDHRIDNVARIARRQGYDPTLFGYTDTSVDPRIVEDPNDPRLFDYEGVLPGFTPATVLTWRNMGPWLAWLEAHGHQVPTRWEELFEPLAGFAGSDQHAPSWAPSRFPAEHTETAFLTERFVEWLDQRPDASPWFAHVSFIRPHPPYRAPEGYHDRYDPDDGPAFRRSADRRAELAMHPLHAAGAGLVGCPVDEHEARQLRATYWGNMAEVDDQLARLLGHLEELGQRDDTLIVLTADHGDQMGDHWLVEKLGWWDESYHVPMIVVDPRAEADGTRGTVVDAFTESVDVLPTLCEWIGAEVPVEVDGRALQPFVLEGVTPADWRTEAHWQWDFRDPVDHLPEDTFGLTMEECTLDVVRGPDHKYVHFGNGDSLYFDLTDDPDQLVDRVDDPEHLAAVADARARLLSWRMRHDDRTLTGHRVTAERGLVVRRAPRR